MTAVYVTIGLLVLLLWIFVGAVFIALEFRRTKERNWFQTMIFWIVAGPAYLLWMLAMMTEK